MEDVSDAKCRQIKYYLSCGAKLKQTAHEILFPSRNDGKKAVIFFFFVSFAVKRIDGRKQKRGF